MASSKGNREKTEVFRVLPKNSSESTTADCTTGAATASDTIARTAT